MFQKLKLPENILTKDKMPECSLPLRKITDNPLPEIIRTIKILSGYFIVRLFKYCLKLLRSKYFIFWKTTFCKTIS